MRKRNLVIVVLVLLVSAATWSVFDKKETKLLDAEVQKIVSWSKNAVDGRPIYAFHIGSNDSSLSLQAYTQDGDQLIWDSTVYLLWLDRSESALKWRLVDFSQGTDKPKYRAYANGTELLDRSRMKNEHISELSDRLSNASGTEVLLSDVKDLKLDFESSGSGVLLMTLSVEKEGGVVTESFNLTKRLNPEAWENGQRATRTGVH